MKNGYGFLPLFTVLLIIFSVHTEASAQQYKLRQVTSMTGMKSETTIFVKGMRKRTEGGSYAGMPTLTTIEQCDLQRTITINDRKKLYYIEPFSKEQEEVIDEDAKPASKNKPVAASTKTDVKKGGLVTMWYNITDTGERKKMYGLTARHIWTTQKIVPSPDACMMKDSMIIKTDGWYIDLPEFTCPVRYTNTGGTGGYGQVDCKDRFVTRRSGKGKLGFPLIEKRTMIMGGMTEVTEFVTNLETLEFSTAKLDSMLFEIPLGYTLAKSSEELQDNIDPTAMMEMYKAQKNEGQGKTITPGAVTTAGTVRIGVLLPAGAEQVQAADLQASLVSNLTVDGIEAVAVTSAEEAKTYKCELLLTTAFSKIKSASKIGGLLKAVKNADPSATSSYTIEAQLILTKVADGTTRAEKRVAGKYEGSADGAAKKALEEGSRSLLEGLH